MTGGWSVLWLGLAVLAGVGWVTARRPEWSAVVGGVLTLVLVVGGVLSGRVLVTGAAANWDFGRWSPLAGVAGFPFTLTVDRLSAFFLLLLCTVGGAVAVYSAGYLRHHYRGWRLGALWSLLPLFLLAMAVVLAAGSALAFLFGWELMTLASAAAIAVESTGAADAGGRRHNLYIYLVMMHVGTAAVLAAFLLFLPHAPGLEFATMRQAGRLLPPAWRNAIFLLAATGFGMKAGLIPLHLWLPRTHPMAPSPISALMSAVMLKTAVYGLARFAFDLLGGGPAWWGYLLLVAGAMSAVLGALYALGESDLKRLLAYSSIENMGLIHMALGAALVLWARGAVVWAGLALLAALLHSLNHALFKSLLFLGAGAIALSAHTANLNQMGGLQQRMRLTGVAVLIACAAIAGLPLGNGFVSEWMLYRGLMAGGGGLALAAGAVALTAGLAAACFAQAYGASFLGRARSAEAAAAEPASRCMNAGMLALALGCLLLGIAPGIALIRMGALAGGLIPGAAAAIAAGTPLARLAAALPWLTLGVGGVALAGVTLRRGGLARRKAPAWACGAAALTPRMQYSATSFTEPVRTMFARAYRADRRLTVEPAGEEWFPARASYQSRRTTSYERAFYRPVADAIVRAATRLSELQTGNVQVYLLAIFAALVALLTLMRLT